MAAGFLERVGAEQAGLDIHARKAITLSREFGDFLIRQARADRNRLKALGVIHEPLELAAVARRDLYDPGQPFDGLVQILDLGACDLQRIGRVIGRQHHAVAVQDLAPVGHDGDHRRAIALGPLGKLLMALDLQHQQTPDQQTERQKYHAAHDDCTHPEALQLDFGVANLHHAQAPRTPSQ